MVFETGGMSIGFAGTDYDTFFANVSQQKITYEEFGNKNVRDYKENNTSFANVLTDIRNLFGLVTADRASSAAHPSLVLTEYELTTLRGAYERTMLHGNAGKAIMTQAEYVLYGSYDPLTVTVTHILNNKLGIGWTSYAHTGVPVPVFAKGAGADLFAGNYHQEQIFNKLTALTGVK